MIKNAFVVLTPNQINVFLMKMKTRAVGWYLKSHYLFHYLLYVQELLQCKPLILAFKTSWAYGVEGDRYARDKKLIQETAGSK